MNRNTCNRIYAGFLGMTAGMLLGAPVENPYWTYERLQQYFGDIRGYLRTYKHYAADDDVNGPVIFLRALTDRPGGKEFTAYDAGETWLNYARCGHGMFWWGGEDLSTEHRAYMNLKRGIPAPLSGSAETNGKTASEQIGGQIFSDTWGLINPGNPARAAQMARTAASASHDGEALNGAAFVAGCIAAAFSADSVDEILDAGLSVLPDPCDYRTAVEKVRRFHAGHPREEDFRLCRDYVAEEFNEERFPGFVHIIPNGAIIVLALLYGNGDLGRSIEISVMCGFDTDCNASNVGTILGAFLGLDGIPERYRKPINDAFVLSSVSGFLNHLDIPTFAKEVVCTACRLNDEPAPDWVAMPSPGEILFDFAFPGNTHGLELSDGYSHELRWAERDGRGCVQLQIDGENPPPTDLFFKGCYRRDDFNDERYEPVFAPRVYPRQTVTAEMLFEKGASDELRIVPYLTTASDERICGTELSLTPGEWQSVSLTVPDLKGAQVHDVGWRITTVHFDEKWAWDQLFIRRITVSGKADYSIYPACHTEEFGTVTPFAFNDGKGALQKESMLFESDRDAQGFTGNYYMRDSSVAADVTPVSGGPMLILRGQGTRRYYALGFAAEDRLAILKYEAGKITELAAAPACCEHNACLHMEATAIGTKLTLSVNGSEMLCADDDAFAYGMPGIAHAAAAETLWHEFYIKDI